MLSRRWKLVLVLILVLVFCAVARDLGSAEETARKTAPAVADAQTAALLDRWDELTYAPLRGGARGFRAQGTASLHANPGMISGKFQLESPAGSATEPELTCTDKKLDAALREYVEVLQECFHPSTWREQFAGCTLSSTQEAPDITRVTVEGEQADSIESLTFGARGIPETITYRSDAAGLPPRIEFELSYENVGDQYLITKARAEMEAPWDANTTISLEWKFEYRTRGRYRLPAEVSLGTGSSDGSVGAYSQPFRVVFDDIAVIEAGPGTEGPPRTRNATEKLTQPGILGVVRGADDRPIAGARVDLFWTDTKSYGTARTNHDGEYFILISTSDDQWERSGWSPRDDADDGSDPLPSAPPWRGDGPDAGADLIDKENPAPGWCGTCMQGRWQSDMDFGYEREELTAGSSYDDWPYRNDLRLEVWLDGLLLVRRNQLPVKAGETARIDVQLPVIVNAVGRVVDAAGAPVRGARICAKGAPGDRLFSYQTVAADERGEFAFGAWPETGALLEVRAPGYRPRDVFVQRLDADTPIRLERSEQLALTILNPEGQPLPKGELKILFGGGVLSRVTIDEAGKCLLDELPPGAFTILLEPDWDQAFSLEERIQLPPGKNTARVLTARRTATISGKIRSEASRESPMYIDRISALPLGGSCWPCVAQSDTYRGNFMLKHLPPGAYRLLATSQRRDGLTRVCSMRTVQVVEGHKLQLDLELPMMEPGILEVRVRDAGKAALAHARVALLLPSGEPISPRIRVDRHGRLRSVVGTGEYRLRIDASGFVTQIESGITIQSGQRKSIDVVLTPSPMDGSVLATMFRDDPVVSLTPWKPTYVEYVPPPGTSLRAILELVGQHLKQDLVIDPGVEASGVLDSRRAWTWRAAPASGLLERALSHYGLRWSRSDDGRMRIQENR